MSLNINTSNQPDQTGTLPLYACDIHPPPAGVALVTHHIWFAVNSTEYGSSALSMHRMALNPHNMALERSYSLEWTLSVHRFWFD